LDCGFIPKSSRVSLERFTPKGYLLFLCVDLKIDGSQRSKGVRGGRQESLPRGGAIDGRGELAGVDGFRDSVHQIVKGKHHGVAELTGVSLGMFCWAEEQGEELATRGVLLPLGEIQNTVVAAARA
jgi:hypothetical protein